MGLSTQSWEWVLILCDVTFLPCLREWPDRTPSHRASLDNSLHGNQEGDAVVAWVRVRWKSNTYHREIQRRWKILHKLEIRMRIQKFTSFWITGNCGYDVICFWTCRFQNKHPRQETAKVKDLDAFIWWHRAIFSRKTELVKIISLILEHKASKLIDV